MRNAAQALGFITRINRAAGTPVVKVLDGEVRGRTDVGSYRVTPEGVTLVSEDGQVTFSHKEISGILKGQTVRGYRKNERECFGSVVVIVTRGEEHHLDGEVYEAGKVMFTK